MAKPRVFISSTYYDLRYVREDVARFVKEQGYDPVLFERGQVPYGSQDAPQNYCYKEIDLCDILISIVGGRFGSESIEDGYSVTQKELRHALDLGKQVYIFIDKKVKFEYETYKINKENEMKYRFVDDKRIYEFIDEIEVLPRNNPIFEFEVPQDIVKLLREQWAGLFQRLLQEEADKPKLELINTLRQTAATLQQIISVQSKRDETNQDTIRDIILFNHPAFNRLAEQLNMPFRTVFTTKTELDNFLKACGYIDKSDPFYFDYEYHRTTKNNDTKYILKVNGALFSEEGNLKPWDPNKWDDAYIIVERQEVTKNEISEDDLPF
ncbi:DUF4062 domain-containing protein [Paenibacillus gorillae]|uniref:DUF4062 domain-containing protein n=1 Tax=Paenibacillus gorillae TaxID=1243662 RepID=UPI0004BA2F6D|nr:DUF4062 domain-containing protein [Paenibacillus gorillae]